MVPTRGDEYYTPEIFNNKLIALLDEENKGVSQFYELPHNLNPHQKPFIIDWAEAKRNPIIK